MKGGESIILPCKVKKKGKEAVTACFASALQQNQAAPSRPAETQKNQLKNQMWTGVYRTTLVEGQDLPQYGQGDIYVRFRLGDQKYKSKV